MYDPRPRAAGSPIKHRDRVGIRNHGSLQWDHAKDRKLANKNYWSLFVIFESGNPKQDWKIEHREIPISFEGTGTAREMV
jgi:hypothetical protein